jgi:hypothetical protein
MYFFFSVTFLPFIFLSSGRLQLPENAGTYQQKAKFKVHPVKYPAKAVVSAVTSLIL